MNDDLDELEAMSRDQLIAEDRRLWLLMKDLRQRRVAVNGLLQSLPIEPARAGTIE